MRIFITGAASHLARACLPMLCAETRVTSIVGVDLLPATFFHAKYTHHRCDIRSAEIQKLMRGCDALLHLAWRVLRGKMSAREMQEINVRGTRHVFDVASACAIPRLIHLSSAAVYGSGDKLTEAAPCQPLPHFLYAQHKLEVEMYLALAFPQALCFRPHIIFGSHCQPLLKLLLRLPIYPAYADPQARFQCVHEDDVAQAISLALFSTDVGFFNLASADSFSFKEALLQRHAYTFPLPFTAAQMALNLAWKTTGFGGEPAWLEGTRTSLTLDCNRALQSLRWRPRYTSAAALASF